MTTFVQVTTFILCLIAPFAFYIILYRRIRRRRVGAASAGAMYDLLNEDRRNSVEVIITERAGERDPEDRDGNLPD